MSDDVSIKLPKGAVEGVIDAHIRAAVAQAIGSDPERLIARVVETAMSAKKDSYGRTTIFEDAVNQEIRAVALEEFRAWMEEQRPRIREQVRKRLQSTKLANLLTEGLVKGLSVSVDLRNY